MILREGATPGESAEARLKRMRMRSWRRGTKEMDLVLGPYADTQLQFMDPQALDVYDQLLSQNDQDLMAWITGMQPAPEWLTELLAELRGFAEARLRR